LSLLVASVVPDVSGIDKVFDYIVPDSLVERVWIGARVRIDLNGRRVGGWIVELTTAEDAESMSSRYGRVLSLVSVSGHGVEPEVVPLTKWVSQNFWGSWRAVLSSASAPHVRVRPMHPHRGIALATDDDDVLRAVQHLTQGAAGLIVVPPLASALSVVTQMAQRGTVLVVCPTIKMASLGAASLRRRGLTTAVIPEQWDAARAGVDVVIGARSAAFAPCASISGVIVIDEHDELLHDERAPTWNALDVAVERARQQGVPCIATSPVPSAESLHRWEQATVVVRGDKQWPIIEIVDLDSVPVPGSLLSTEMLSAVTQSGGSVACVLNTKGKARLIVCRSCRGVQECATCGSLLTQDDEQHLTCNRCHHDYGSVCVTCGRTSFVVPRGGISHLATQLRASTSRDVIEVSSDDHDTWTQGSIFVGTEAVLHRISGIEVVVCADIDRDLGAPRMTASREVLALVARAARLVGERGKVIVQTRRPQHPLLLALSQDDVADALLKWYEQDLAQRKMFGLPPFGVLAHVSVKSPGSVSEIPSIEGVDIARFEDFAIVKASTRDELGSAITQIRESLGASARVHADPVRY
jgi:primosomal protein N' (replication factor Y)